MESEAIPSPSLPSRTIYVAKKSVAAFFDRPLHYLFYSTLSCVIVGLLCGARFSAILYVILLCLGGIEVVQSVGLKARLPDPKSE